MRDFLFFKIWDGMSFAFRWIQSLYKGFLFLLFMVNWKWKQNEGGHLEKLVVAYVFYCWPRGGSIYAFNTFSSYVLAPFQRR